MSAELPSGTVTFLFTDIEGSTRLLHALGPEAYAEALAEHRRALRAAFAAHGGVEVDTQGDAFFVAFPTAPGAASAAVDGQAALDLGPLRVRMGLHTGTPTVTGEGYVGVDVHRGARVAALAHGGQVVLSPATAALLDGEGLGDLGLHRLKDFDGATRLHQLGRGEFPALRTPGSVELPTPATRFLGRERELFDAVALVLEHDPRVLTVVGPGGTGKTRFAIELARLLAEDADGGTLFIPLAPVHDPALVLAALAEAIGAEGPQPAQIANRVGARRTHVVIDNVEQLLPAAAESLSAAATAAPSLRLLVTSREALRIGAEMQFELPPLAADEAGELFVARARAVRPELTTSAAVDELCARLDHLPLAIELAAARTKLLSPEALLERLGARLDLPAQRDADPRHATLRATISWSYDLLDEEERRLFESLGVFAGGCTLESAEDVCEADLETLASLLDKSLVRRRAVPDDADRYWMLETIREYATGKLTQTGREDHVRGRQSDWLRGLAERAGFGAVVEWTRPWRPELVIPELDNVRDVLTWALENDPERGLELATSLEEFWVVREPTQGAAWLEQLLEAAPDAPAELRAKALRALGGSTEIFGGVDRATQFYRESLTLFDALGDELHSANLRFRLAANTVNRGELAEGRKLLENALADFERLGSVVGEAQALGVMGYLALQESDFETAPAYFVRSAELVRELGWTWWEINMLGNLAEASRQLGEVDAAERHARRALELAIELGDRQGSVFAAAELACAAALRDDAAGAGRLWGAIAAEEDEAPVGQWSEHRSAYAEVVERVLGTEFDSAVERGRFLSLEDAAAGRRGEAQTEP